MTNSFFGKMEKILIEKIELNKKVSAGDYHRRG